MEEFIAHAPVLIPVLIVLGLAAGFMAGLLGIGGGIILVPGLYFLFKTLGYDPEALMHLSVGTSLAIIIPTGISSALSHYRRGAVRFDLVKHIGPGIVTGVIAGTAIADRLDGDSLVIVFAAALLLFAALMQLPPKVKEDGAHSIGPVKGTVGGFFVGTLSSLMGIGGATLNVPFMTLSGVSIHNAVATASALGPFIALPGAIGFLWIGLDESNLPPFSFGYINLLAALLIAPLSVLAAPWGVKTAHSVSVKTLRRIFSIFIVIVAIKMIWDAAHGG
jgi:uncharacterized membrane protein YfcA